MFKFFKFPFASQGDKNSVPDGVQTDGSVSYEQGFGYDYARNLADDPLAKPMPRDKTNQIFHDVTQAIREYQTLGIPDYIELEQNGGEAFAYEKYAVVRYGGSVYVSLKAGNTSLPTAAADWDEVPGIKATDAEAEAGTDDTKIMTPAKVNKAIQKLAPKTDTALLLRSGLVSWFASSAAPTGWLKANGAAISRTAYADLFAAIGTIYGAGDGSTTFNLPDLRGEFIRGYDDGRGVDAGRTIGSWQDSDNKAHGHSYTDPGHAHYYRRYEDPGGGDGSPGGNGRATVLTSTATTGITINSSGGTESRPRNIALLACIKY